MSVTCDLSAPILAELVIGSPQWIVPTLVIGTALTFLVLWNYSRSDAARIPTAWLGLILKLAAIALLAVCLLQPMRRAQRPRPRANLLPILVDTSGSMDLTVGRSEDSWRDRIDADLATDSAAFSSMSQSFETRIYGFDKRLASVGEVGDLRRHGTGSRLLENLSELTQRLRGRPVAGALLMSDGNVPGGTNNPDDLPKFDFPVYPVIPAQVTGLNDMWITSTTVRQTNFEISPVTVSVQFAVTGNLVGEAIARLTDVADGSMVAEKKVQLQTGEPFQNVSFQFRPNDVGLQFYRVDLFREVDRKAISSGADLVDTTSSETTLVNNTRLIAVDRRGGPYRILYVAGRPNWEFKFLRRAVSEDAEVELTGLFRIANKEPKFSFRDRDVSSTNPLFQGLGNDAEETAEQYDEPVMVRIGVKESDELAGGFPKTEEELFAFDGLIIDDIEPEFFSQDQLAMVRRFVSSRGGGLMLLGGQEMFQGRVFADSVLGDLSPVYVSRSSPAEADRYAVQLTREGMLQPWMRLRETADLEAKRLRTMTDFTSVNAIGSLKPGAYQLATVTGASGKPQPAVAVQRFGKGKVGAVAIADLWRWFMNPDPNHPDDAAQNWRQFTRWLVGDVPRRAELSSKLSDSQDDSIELRVDVYDESFLPSDNPTTTVRVVQPDGTAITLDPKPIGEVPGAFTVSYFGDQSGAYVATAEVRSEDGELIGTPSTGWTQQIAGREFDQLGVNREQLQAIATASGGRLVREDELETFSRQLESAKVPVMETWVFPLWHRGWVIGLALACLCGEWGIRRWRGLA
ncbi:hypothetical protein NHH03_15710 [Stieleria sp. TO1_6]|uniref:hypothetical protein n=1 Tax=Stieleria tagensis TaxID=2956795 RepID=UPI00209AE730|nr:hypothetical protein [Stieleria tagensis]MCO8123195.1 hypothetical protein [Stieleria tagensis]